LIKDFIGVEKIVSTYLKDWFNFFFLLLIGLHN
jgi:hypothetical protein